MDTMSDILELEQELKKKEMAQNMGSTSFLGAGLKEMTNALASSPQKKKGNTGNPHQISVSLQEREKKLKEKRKHTT